MSDLILDHPWLEFDLGAEMQVLSWSINRPGCVSARRILWREVHNSDLQPDVDVSGWLEGHLSARGACDAVAFLTSCDIRRYQRSEAVVGDAHAQVVATVGLSNAERVGHRLERPLVEWGTINVALKVDRGLSEAALLELMSIATQARTAAVMDLDLPLSVGRATGTGTDCVAVAAPPGDEPYAGLHTEIGEAAGRAVYSAVLEGGRGWMASIGARISVAT